MTATLTRVERPVIVPTEKQRLALSLDVDELLFGGSAGGGKSYALIAAGLRMCRLVPGSAVLLLRRTHQELHELRRRIGEYATEATFNKGEAIFYFPNGSEFRLGHAQYDDDVQKWQGAELQLLLVDELTQFTKYQYTYLRGRLRASGTVLQKMNELGIRPHSLATANPGGIGHAWVKQRFISPAPAFQRFRTQTGTVRAYVPSRLTDNPHLDQQAYLQALSGLDPVMRRAMIEGDWDILLGSVRFPQWRRDLHVVEPEDYPLELVGHPRAVGVDYGVADPFAAVWGALMPDGTVVIYRELMETDMTASQQAQLILDSEAEGERDRGRPVPVAADRSMWNRMGNSGAKLAPGSDAPDKGSIAYEYYKRFGGQLHRSNSDRLAGWAMIDELLRPRPCEGSCGREDCPGHPRLVVYSTCVNVIRDLPSLPRDKRNPEDAATHNVNDHVPDALRYLVMELVLRGQRRSSLESVAGRRERVRSVSAGLRDRGF
ncbi:terminase large subunit domain-containing protein [Brevibacterium moorei]|uniref:terminase large subunit domain-containing protein n=1 Tax=Brevibacterium moorei TaxID=2968457 RepID=UPI00211C6255|nr:terminase family protein [Brevibacterium sp. 68QC2CO]MCQ9384429.1 terminase family protein [Brevibacterium sp. 68QC2CO]